MAEIQIRAKILARDLYFSFREMLKDALKVRDHDCEDMRKQLKTAEIENLQLKSTVQSLQSDLRKALSERDSAISERYQHSSASHLQEDLALLLATSKMQQAQLKSELENIKDELGATLELVKVRDREIEGMNREMEKLRKQNGAMMGKPANTSRNVTPGKDAPVLRSITGMEKKGIKPFPGLFGLGRSIIPPRPAKSGIGTDRRPPASMNSSLVESAQPASKRSLNSSVISDSKSSVKCE